MRSDVKLGFAIGGVLLAVLIVYVLVVPGGTSAPKLSANTPAASKGGSGEKVSLEPVAPLPKGTQTNASPDKTSQPTAVGESHATGSASATESNDHAAKSEGAVATKTEPPKPAVSNAGKIDWDKLLNDQPLMVAQTPTSVSSKTAPPSPTPAPITPAADVTTPQGGAVEPSPTPDATAVLTPGPAPESQKTPAAEPSAALVSTERPTIVRTSNSTTQPSIAGGRTHVVQRNETLSSIAAAAYGSSNRWPSIVKANPGIDPNHLKPGTTLVLPDAKDVKLPDAQTASAGSSSTAQPIDSSKQYRVQSGDSLYKISLKLYGKSTMQDKLYQLNKQTIGEDSHKLKVGQVLELPEPPTATASR